MHCTCVRQTDLPQTSHFFADVLYHPDRVVSFLPHALRDLDAFRAAAAQTQFSERKRADLISALRVQNSSNPLLDQLAQPGTVAIVTGQQAGLFCGPAYTIYKALHAIRLARWLSENGVSAVPVFWVATEDHDFLEVNHLWVFDYGHRPVRVEMRRTVSGQPVGEVVLADPPVNELAAALDGHPHGDEVAALVRRVYRTGLTMGRAFEELLRGILGRFEILIADPMLPAFRELAAPAIRTAIQNAPELTSRVLERNRELTTAGYHAQVHVEDQTSLVFLLENGKRLTLRRRGAEYHLNGRSFSQQELMDRAASLSPNALLRPVVEDSILPTAAYIGGPAEIAYLAQAQVIYQSILGRMPVPVPRSSFTIIDEHSQKAITRYGLSLSDFFQGEDTLREHIAAKLVPSHLQGVMRESATKVEQAVEQLRAELIGFDPTLAKALGHSARKIQHQFGKIEAKAGREALRRDERATRAAASLSGLIYPERRLQERLYSILPFMAKHGLDLVEKVHGAIQLDCADHRLMVL